MLGYDWLWNDGILTLETDTPAVDENCYIEDCYIECNSTSGLVTFGEYLSCYNKQTNEFTVKTFPRLQYSNCKEFVLKDLRHQDNSLDPSAKKRVYKGDRQKISLTIGPDFTPSIKAIGFDSVPPMSFKRFF